MPFSRKTIAEKPYNMCINCDHLGNACDGPNFLAMSTERWCEWCRIRKEYLELTNADIAETSGVSLVSVGRIMSGAAKDVRLTTMQAITKVLVNGTWGTHPCAMKALPPEVIYQDRPEVLAECKNLQEQHAEDERKIAFLRKQLEIKDTQIMEKDLQLKDRAEFIRHRDKAAVVLGVLLGIAVLIIIAALVIDAANPNVGFFWRL